jgi:hypothetical protein
VVEADKKEPEKKEDTIKPDPSRFWIMVGIVVIFLFLIVGGFTPLWIADKPETASHYKKTN